MGWPASSRGAEPGAHHHPLLPLLHPPSSSPCKALQRHPQIGLPPSSATCKDVAHCSRYGPQQVQTPAPLHHQHLAGRELLPLHCYRSFSPAIRLMIHASPGKNVQESRIGQHQAGELTPAVAFCPGKASRDVRPPLHPSPWSSAASRTGSGGNLKALRAG